MTAPSFCSSSFSYGWKYDVFLSFRGQDTRYGFTGNLYKALHERGIDTFIDDEELQRGNEIIPSLVKAIEESRIAITVLSRNYASSSFCLDELSKIFECIKSRGRLVLPVFYDVDPCDVRHQRGSYGEALAKHEERFKDDMEKVQNWRKALHQVANLSGWHLKHGEGYEYEFIGRIVEVVSSKINRTPLHVADYTVGLESRVSKVISLLDVGSDDRVHMIGIHGIGGIGKTTIASAVYNLIADQFEGLCFLENVRENSSKHGFQHLQKILLSEILGEKKIKITSVKKGIPIIKHRLHQKKVLLILDDVDKLEQLETLVGNAMVEQSEAMVRESDWFGSGSRVIITTRDKHLLTSHRVARTYEVELLNEKEALELLSWNAFKTDKVDPSYMGILNSTVTYASGLPLALEVIGSNLSGKRIKEWESALDRYKRIPNKEIQKLLKVSFDALEEEEQRVFLDIACCFKGFPLVEVEDILHAHHGGCMKHHIRVLVDRSLINIDNYNVTLHDLIEDMGKEIVRQEAPKELGKRSRLWLPEDIVQVLEDNTGTSDIEIICLDFHEFEEVNWDGEAFKKMTNLKTLIIRNSHFSECPKHLPNSLRALEWWGYPSESLPIHFHPKKLAIFKLPKSRLMSIQMLEMQKVFANMKFLNFSDANCITEIPDVSGVPNLEELVFQGCENLIKIHVSVGFLYKLRVLDACHCKKLMTFPPIKLTSLKILSLSGCSNLESFPEILGEMENITELSLIETGIKELPLSIRNLTQLRSLYLEGSGIVQLPSIILPKLNKLFLLDCKGLLLAKQDDSEEQVSSMLSSNLEVSLNTCNISDEFLQTRLTWFANVKYLCLSMNVFAILPACIKEFHFLTELVLDRCKNLQEIRGIPPNLETLSAAWCSSLKELDLTLLPAGTKECPSLSILKLKFCKNLREIRGIPSNIKVLEVQNCPSLNSWCRSKILNEEFHEEGGNKNFYLPGTRVPEWFEHCRRGLRICFWFRNKFPMISLCVTTASTYIGSCICFPKLMINGHIVGEEFLSGQEFMHLDHMVIFDVKQIKFKTSSKRNGWNHAVFYADAESGVLSKQVGLHVFKSESSMEDIQFTDTFNWSYAKMCPPSMFSAQVGSTTIVQGCEIASRKRKIETLRLDLDNEVREPFHQAPLKVALNSDSIISSLASDAASERDLAFLDNLAKALEESSQAPGFPTMQNIQAPNPTSSSSEVSGEELHLKKTCCTACVCQQLKDLSSLVLLASKWMSSAACVQGTLRLDNEVREPFCQASSKLVWNSDFIRSSLLSDTASDGDSYCSGSSTSMEDVQITNPKPLKNICDDSCYSNGDMGNQLTLLDYGLCEAPDIHQQQEDNAEINDWLLMPPCWEQPSDHVYCNSDSIESAKTIDSTNDVDRPVLDHLEKAPGESSQAPGFNEMQNIQAPSPTSSSGKVSGEELHLKGSFTLLATIIDRSFRNQIELSQDDVEMEAFYASLDAGAHVLSRSHDKLATTAPSEEAREALKIVLDFISGDASVLLHPEQCSVMKTSLDYLSNLSANNGILAEMRTLISEASRVFAYWSRDYIEASRKIESTASKLQRADELEASLEGNKKKFSEVLALENELLDKLACMEESKKELEEQINAIKANISASQSEKNMTRKRKRDIFEEGKALKTQMDELREKVPNLQHEQGLAKKTQAKIKAEWSKLREKFRKIVVE